jgi:hypothetical protein
VLGHLLCHLERGLLDSFLLLGRVVNLLARKALLCLQCCRLLGVGLLRRVVLLGVYCVDFLRCVVALDGL